MTIKEAASHIWLSQSTRPLRSKSQNTCLNEEFHDEMNHKMVNALPQEAESKKGRRLVSKKVASLRGSEF